MLVGATGSPDRNIVGGTRPPMTMRTELQGIDPDNDIGVAHGVSTISAELSAPMTSQRTMSTAF